jgi:hypothetical protein
MKYVVLYHLKEAADQAKVAEMMARRAEYQFPTGMNLIAECWTGNTRNCVVGIYDVDDPATALLNSVAWLDAFTIEALPATTWEEGLARITAHLAGN